MPETSSIRPSLPATALIIDIRDFTPTFHAFDREEHGDRFLDFVDRFQGVCVRCCRASFDGDPGERLYLSSTGDGVLAVFEGAPSEPDSHHALRAWLVALRLAKALPPVFEELDGVAPTKDAPRFGIGMESGFVKRVGMPPIGTRLGHCINRAARLEPITKTFAATMLVVGEECNRLLTKGLHGADYVALATAARDSAHAAHDPPHQWQDMRALNDALGLLWLGAVKLKGVSKPVLAFRNSATWFAGDLSNLIADVEGKLRTTGRE
jgi:class 3 adenylate cyclase